MGLIYFLGGGGGGRKPKPPEPPTLEGKTHTWGISSPRDLLTILTAKEDNVATENRGSGSGKPRYGNLTAAPRTCWGSPQP